MDTDKTPAPEAKAKAFVVTHCWNCAAGWKRVGKDHDTITVCLLDREPVWNAMTDCDRYELRQPDAN